MHEGTDRSAGIGADISCFEKMPSATAAAARRGVSMIEEQRIGLMQPRAMLYLVLWYIFR